VIGRSGKAQVGTMKRLEGKVAVVTGGTQGIGQGVVLRFLKEGARVVYCSRNTKNNDAMLPLIAAIPDAAGRAQYIQADVGIKEQIQSVVHAAAKLFGGVDIVINNAQGIAPLRAIEEKPDADYAMTLATGFYHSLWAGQAALPYMRERGGGRIINCSSHWALQGMRYASDYAITKAANEALTRTMANEWGRFNVLVNCFVPAGDSFAYRQYKQQNRALCEGTERNFPLQRMGDCETDIAGGILGLVSENGRYITGTTIYIDGGAWLVHPAEGEHEVGTDIHAGRAQSAGIH
jgi:NAD(P)-dependent dehydrogenase (short-subunit alcohol dehydrogenase family)